MIAPEVKEALNKLRYDCTRELYGECHTLGCMRKDSEGKFIKPYEFVGCTELIVFNAYLEAEWRRRKAEFQLEHEESPIGNVDSLSLWCNRCDCSRFSGNWDERHQ